MKLKIIALAALIGLLFQVTTTEAQTKKLKRKDDVVILNTNFGEIVIMLYDVTPLHKANFLKLAKEGQYDGNTFHRIIKNFMIQGGDPNSKDADKLNDGQGGPGYTIPAEFVDSLVHVQGAVAAARLGDVQNPKKESSGSQFYIVENKGGTHFLDQSYTVFGKVIKGIDVVEKIAEQPKDRMDRPFNDITMTMKVKRMRVKKIIKRYGAAIRNPVL